MSSSKTEANSDFHIVGVGASAGGLDAIEKLFKAMPEDTGAAFVVVQHLSPDFKSHMGELLARKTNLTIKSIENDMPVEPNTIYLIPPNTEMMISDRRLLLTERERSESLNLPIDHFFRSLANDCGHMSIGVILSGTGSDGSRGIMGINEAGGLVICQDQESAKFDGMPLSAQNTNAVHLVLAPEKISSAIDSYISQSISPEALAEQEIGVSTETGLDEIFSLLRRQYGTDFALYKPATVKRRIERRILLGSYSSVDRYAEVLGREPGELNTLYKDLLIGVTEFFRDPKAFDLLKKELIPKIIEKKRGGNEEIRVWIAGCATGEEAYSVAISFHEALGSEKTDLSVKIFATDVNRTSLAAASTGVYPESSLGKISTKRRERYFVKRPDGYEIVPAIREMIVFAAHNLVNDAPFTRMDLVTCRNLLIYLQPAMQKKVISLFHFALRTGGYMFMGPSETPGDLLDEFEIENKKWRLYSKRRDIRLNTSIKLPLSGANSPRPFSRSHSSSRPTPESQMLGTYDQLLDKYMAPSFLVDEGGELVHSFGGAERFLQFRGGRISTNLLDIIHEDLKTSVAGALQHSAKEQKAVRYTGIQVNTSLGVEQVRLVVEPMRDQRTEIVHTLISVEPIEQTAVSERIANGIAENIDDVDFQLLSREHVSGLENELRYTKENLQATVEELETSNEELQASNEELVASNEEMQSTNEELQSVNEELYTVNGEYQQKIVELTEMTDDVNNLFSSTDVGVIFLDRDLNIRRFTPKIAGTFHLLPQDIGRPIQGFAHNLESDLFEDVRTVLKTEEAIDREVRDRQQNYWLMRIIPYRTASTVEGLVLTLVDINLVKRTNTKLQGYRDLVESADVGILGCDEQGTIITWNAGAETIFGYSEDEVLGQHVSMFAPEGLADETKAILDRVRTGEAVLGLETKRIRKDGAELVLIMNVSPVSDENGNVTGFSNICTDHTARKKIEQERTKLAEIIDSTSDFVGTYSTEGKTLSLNPAALKMLNVPEGYDFLGKPFSNWHSGAETERIRNELFPAAIESGVWRGVTHLKNHDGEEIPMSTVVLSHRDATGSVKFLSTIGRDISNELELQKQLSDRESLLRQTLDGLYAFAGICLPDGTLIEANQTALATAGVKLEDVLNKPFADGPWWSGSQAAKDQMHTAIKRAAQGNVVRYDVDVPVHDDEVATFDFQLTPLKDDDGEITHLIPSAIDISDRVAFESQSRIFRRAFDSSLTAMVICDASLPDLPLTYVNPGFTELTGYTAEEAVGRNCRFLQGKETDKKSVKKLSRAIKNGESCQIKLLNYRKDGRKFWNELVITPVKNEKDETTHFIGLQFDVTDHQRAEDRLARARDVAEAANSAKSGFVANMSHEIRTPITTVVGMTEMLLEQEKDSANRDMLKMVHQSGQHLETLVNDVLDLSKIEAGKLEADLVDACPQQIIEDVAAVMEYRARERNLEFTVKYDGLIPDEIKTDPIRLRQILYNLTGNAVKFTEKGSVEITVKLIDRSSKPKLRVTVEDTGIGFPDGQAERLFDQFTQVDESLTRRQNGTGLGLYISRCLAELLDAKISAKGKRGGGSVFTLAVPTGDLSGRVFRDPQTELADAKHPRRTDLQKLTGEVLVVEDTRGIQMLIRRILERAGAEVCCVDNGEEAIDLIKKLNKKSGDSLPWGAIVMDMHMPSFSGYDTTKKIRAMGIKTPIIALTASAMRGDREQCLEAGCDDYLTKPIDRAKLLSTLAKLTEKQGLKGPSSKKKSGKKIVPK